MDDDAAATPGAGAVAVGFAADTGEAGAPAGTDADPAAAGFAAGAAVDVAVVDLAAGAAVDVAEDCAKATLETNPKAKIDINLFIYISY